MNSTITSVKKLFSNNTEVGKKFPMIYSLVIQRQKFVLYETIQMFICSCYKGRYCKGNFYIRQGSHSYKESITFQYMKPLASALSEKVCKVLQAVQNATKV